MILIAHQLGHKVTAAGGGVVEAAVVLGTHTRRTYDHRRMRRPGRFIEVLTWMFS